MNILQLTYKCNLLASNTMPSKFVDFLISQHVHDNNVSIEFDVTLSTDHKAACEQIRSYLINHSPYLYTIENQITVTVQDESTNKYRITIGDYWHEIRLITNVVICADCGKYHSETNIDSLLKIKDNLYCDRTCAYNNGYRLCIDCGKWVKRAKSDTSPTKLKAYKTFTERDVVYTVCIQCFKKDNWVKCTHCNCLRPKEFINKETGYCNHCMTTFRRCAVCNKYHPNSDFEISIDHNLQLMCRKCVNNRYWKCNQCGAYTSREVPPPDSNHQLCLSCLNQRRINEDIHNRILNYTHKPTTLFHWWKPQTKEIVINSTAPNKIPFLGMELEVEVPKSVAITDAVDICDSHNKWMYLKKDGSINRGFEIVTHPFSISAWHVYYPQIEELCKNFNEKAISAETQSIHVHISKKDMSMQHKCRFQTFFDANKTEMVKFAQRESERYAAYKQVSHKNWLHVCKQCNNNRYMAVNWFNIDTVEVRIFRGSTNPVRILACIEIVYGIYQFTKGVVGLANIANGNSWKPFLDFISTGSEYKYLRKYLKEHN